MAREMGSLGAFSGRGSGSEQSRQAGLPFSGIPAELETGVRKIMAKEPVDDSVEVVFDQAEAKQPPLTLRTLFAPHYPALALAFLMVLAQTGAMQVGPLLTQIGIDKGIVKANVKVLIWVSLAYLLSILLNYITGYARIAWTGRLGERLMMNLRIKVFSHLQRLSLDFFTDEMSGRIMTRMTSDIEALTTLLQDGIINLMVQGLTMILRHGRAVFFEPEAGGYIGRGGFARHADFVTLVSKGVGLRVWGGPGPDCDLAGGLPGKSKRDPGRSCFFSSEPKYRQPFKSGRIVCPGEFLYRQDGGYF